MSQINPGTTASPTSRFQSVAESYVYCEQLARREAANFYHAFRLLPRPQRNAMSALYAFMRVTDDVTDGPGEPAAKRAALKNWGQELDLALAGMYTHPLHAAFHHTVRTYGIPRVYLDAVLEGVAMDLEPVRFAVFADLYAYCYRVASVVGLSCIHIWGFTDEKAKVYAEAAGIGFQLTNILRDLGEDARRGRIYLPGEDMKRFGYYEVDLFRGERNEAFRAMMQFQAERARQFYDRSGPLSAHLGPPGRAVFQAMSRTYRGLLEAIVAADYRVFDRRIRLSRLRKLWYFVQALPVRWGRRGTNYKGTETQSRHKE
jgi:phytoene synthase